MSKRSGSRRATRRPAHVAGRPVNLVAGIAVVLGGWLGTLAASPFADVDINAARGAPPGTAATIQAAASSPDAEFDRHLLSGGGHNTADLTRFEHANQVSPGIYNADIYFNDAWVARSSVRLAATAADANASLCVDRNLLDELNFHPDKVSAEMLAQLSDPKACVSLGSLIPGATHAFNMASLRLDTFIPQAYIQQPPRGYVSPKLWDAGVPAALLNYRFNAYHSSSQGQNQTTGYLGLAAGLNIELWHFRQDSNLSWRSAIAQVPARSQWQDIDTYAQRELPSLRALLTLGDSNADGQIFNSFALRGIQLTTDDRMLPQSLQGYAPTVRGVAQTNAVVTVRDNGLLIYQITVAPGPFEIKDLYPTGYGGRLEITVTEADGRVRAFSVPYASVAQLLRPGITRFDISAGQLRDTYLVHQPVVAQVTLQHGFSNLLTGYAGIVASQGYAAALAGSAINTGYGAVAFDITQAHTQIPGLTTQSGHSLRLSYSKILAASNTSLTVAANRHSSSGYLSLTDAALVRDYARRGLNALDELPSLSVPTIDGLPVQSLLTPAQESALSNRNADNAGVNSHGLQRQRNSFSISISQRLGQHGGSFYLSASTNDYWNRTATNTQFQGGYSNAFHRVSYSISAMRTLDLLGHYNNEFLLSFTVPLGNSVHAPALSLNSTYEKSTGSQEQVMLSGAAGADSQFSYGTTATHSGEGTGNAGTVNAGYRGAYAVVSASYGSGSNYSQSSLGISGGIVAHPGGVTFGQPMGDTVGIVYVPDAAGTRLANAAGVHVDHFGYALVPYLTPYISNTIQIDPKGLPLDVQLGATSAQVAPYAGAVVMLKFATESGHPLIMRVRVANGQSLPFGAEVVNSKGVTLGVTGQGGQVLLRVVDRAGWLTARWVAENGTAQSCSLYYQVSPRGKEKRLHAHEEIQATCAPVDAVTQTGSKAI